VDEDTITVRPGDTLGSLAKANGATSWRALYEANRDVIGADPNQIKPGQVLTIGRHRAPEVQQVRPPVPVASASSQGQQAVKVALQQVGDPYVWGA
ncbi:LysM peptidoglycan-binding domain-containing protein, partial [Nocardia farcinica]|uniref:LysM peptidoglycan-binding domain-containing protein n=1 Tax=Nocardia farcinica TaxID=37329 RepID=UPI001B3C72AA